MRLAEHRAKVMKQERELHRAKAEQQKAELAAKRKLLLQKERAARQDLGISSCDPDEGNAKQHHPLLSAHYILVSVLLLTICLVYICHFQYIYFFAAGVLCLELLFCSAAQHLHFRLPSGLPLSLPATQVKHC